MVEISFGEDITEQLIDIKVPIKGSKFETVKLNILDAVGAVSL